MPTSALRAASGVQSCCSGLLFDGPFGISVCDLGGRQAIKSARLAHNQQRNTHTHTHTKQGH